MGGAWEFRSHCAGEFIVILLITLPHALFTRSVTIETNNDHLLLIARNGIALTHNEERLATCSTYSYCTYALSTYFFCYYMS